MSAVYLESTMPHCDYDDDDHVTSSREYNRYPLKCSIKLSEGDYVSHDCHAISLPIIRFRAKFV
jgi:hypothetical protein